MLREYNYDGTSSSSLRKDFLGNYTVTEKGIWQEIPYTFYSDYSGCQVERSNYITIKQDFNNYLDDDVIRSVWGYYGTTGLLVRSESIDKHDDIRELIDELESYPCYDENHLWILESEALNEALYDYGYQDIADALEIDLDNLNKLSTARLIESECLYAHETGGLVWIDVDKTVELLQAEPA